MRFLFDKLKKIIKYQIREFFLFAKSMLAVFLFLAYLGYIYPVQIWLFSPSWNYVGGIVQFHISQNNLSFSIYSLDVIIANIDKLFFPFLKKFFSFVLVYLKALNCLLINFCLTFIYIYEYCTTLDLLKISWDLFQNDLKKITGFEEHPALSVAFTLDYFKYFSVIALFFLDYFNRVTYKIREYNFVWFFVLYPFTVLGWAFPIILKNDLESSLFTAFLSGHALFAIVYYTYLSEHNLCLNYWRIRIFFPFFFVIILLLKWSVFILKVFFRLLGFIMLHLFTIIYMLMLWAHLRYIMLKGYFTNNYSSINNNTRIINERYRHSYRNILNELGLFFDDVLAEKMELPAYYLNGVPIYKSNPKIRTFTFVLKNHEFELGEQLLIHEKKDFCRFLILTLFLDPFLAPPRGILKKLRWRSILHYITYRAIFARAKFLPFFRFFFKKTQINPQKHVK